MNKSKSKYFNTAVRMDEALLSILEQKNFDFVTVKEICERAGVNRSTFYLHYDTMVDLLNECIEYLNKKCFDLFGADVRERIGRIQESTLNELILVTPEILVPYLSFIQENSRLFKTALKHSGILNASETFEKMYRSIFEPILERFRFKDNEKKYVIFFYVHGLMAIVTEWLKSDCQEPVEEIASIMIKCVIPNGDTLSNE